MSDKFLHFGAGFLVAAISYVTTGSLPVALFAAWFAGVAKELYDTLDRDKHTPDIWDAVATWAGWMPVASVSLLL